MERIFSDIPDVNLLEKEEKWYEACRALYGMWKENRDDLEKLMRLLWECWYLDVEDLCFVNFTEEESDDVRHMFREAYRYGEEHFDRDGKYRWITGYMLSIEGFLMYDLTVYQEQLKIPGIHILDLAEQEAEYRLISAIGILPDEIVRREGYLGTVRDAAAKQERKRIRKLFEKKRLTADEKEEKQKIEKEMEENNRKIKEYFPSDSLIDEYFREIYTMAASDLFE